MEKDIEIFTRRWNTIEKEVLSSVRKQLKAYSFDESKINYNFQKSCDEWFEGRLAPSIWYKELSTVQPSKAEAFRDYIKNVKFIKKESSKPSTTLVEIISSMITIVFGILAYYFADYYTGWNLLGIILFSISIGTIIWLICKWITNSISKKRTDKIVDFYQQQLTTHGEKLKHILS